MKLYKYTLYVNNYGSTGFVVAENSTEAINKINEMDNDRPDWSERISNLQLIADEENEPILIL